MKAIFTILVVLGSLFIKEHSLAATGVSEHSRISSAIQLPRYQSADVFAEPIESVLDDETLFSDGDDDDFSTIRRKFQLSRFYHHFSNTITLSPDFNSHRYNLSTRTHFCLPAQDRCILIQVFRI